jgi:hypothetical protein
LSHFEGVENTSGIAGKDFFPALYKYFADLPFRGWLLFFLGVAGYLFIFHGIPHLLRKYGGEGWSE